MSFKRNVDLMIPNPKDDLLVRHLIYGMDEDGGEDDECQQGSNDDDDVLK